MSAWLLVDAAAFGAALILSALLVPVCRAVARRRGLVSQPHPDKEGATPVPLLGGMAIFLSFLAVTAAGVCLVVASRSGGLLARVIPPDVLKYAPGVVKESGRLLALLLGGVIMFVLGLADDRWSLRPAPKLLVEAAVGLGLALSGVRVSLFVSSPVIPIVATVLWVVVITNAFNFLDNMDGLAAGVAALAGVFFFVTAVRLDEFFIAALLAAYAGAVSGFLVHNFHPATVYMGDAGSLFIGYVLAGLTILGTYYTSQSPTALAVILPIVVLAIPLYEIVTVTFIRMRKGASVFRASRDHFSFRLRGLGMTPRGAVLFTYLMTCVIGAGAVQLPKVDLAGAILILAQTVAVLTIVALLEMWGGWRARREAPDLEED